MAKAETQQGEVKHVVRFRQLTPPYQTGEQAAFSPDDAQALVDGEIADFVEERRSIVHPPRNTEQAAPVKVADVVAEVMAQLRDREG